MRTFDKAQIESLYDEVLKDGKYLVGATPDTITCFIKTKKGLVKHWEVADYKHYELTVELRKNVVYGNAGFNFGDHSPFEIDAQTGKLIRNEVGDEFVVNIISD